MPYFLVVHKMEAFPQTADEWIDSWRRMRELASGELEWIQSYYVPEAGTLCCEWKAETVDEIRRCFSDQDLEWAPIESVQEIVIFHPEWMDDVEE